MDIVLNLGFTFLDCEYQNVVQMCPELTKFLPMKDEIDNGVVIQEENVRSA